MSRLFGSAPDVWPRAALAWARRRPGHGLPLLPTRRVRGSAAGIGRELPPPAALGATWPPQSWAPAAQDRCRRRADAGGAGGKGDVGARAMAATVGGPAKRLHNGARRAYALLKPASKFVGVGGGICMAAGSTATAGAGAAFAASPVRYHKSTVYKRQDLSSEPEATAICSAAPGGTPEAPATSP
mmetsp:Transcript_76614/g.221462  ORF Transcript_76614/g.221462 Transcript_76614/m.221462 type:complete len:185 (-) Transcript_76614:1175-1729(-)